MVAAGNFAVSLIRSWSEFKQHRKEWSKIRAADSRAEIFTHFDWLTAIAHTYGDVLVPCCPVISISGKPVAIYPVGVRDGVLNFRSSPRGDFNDLILAADSSLNATDLNEVCRLAFSSLDDPNLN